MATTLRRSIDRKRSTQIDAKLRPSGGSSDLRRTRLVRMDERHGCGRENDRSRRQHFADRRQFHRRAVREKPGRRQAACRAGTARFGVSHRRGSAGMRKLLAATRARNTDRMVFRRPRHAFGVVRHVSTRACGNTSIHAGRCHGGHHQRGAQEIGTKSHLGQAAARWPKRKVIRHNASLSERQAVLKPDLLKRKQSHMLNLSPCADSHES